MLSSARAVFIGLAAFIAFGPLPAHAGCTIATEQRAFERALRDTFACAARRLRAGNSASCVQAIPPTCGAEPFAQAVDLLGGFPPASADGPRRHCQVAAYHATKRFLAQRIDERTDGLRQQRRSRHAMKRVERECTLDPAISAGGPAPRFGGRCASLGEGPNGSLVGPRVARCLRPGLEAIVNSLLELPPVQPNVVLVVTDDQRADTVALMPSVQAIALQGVVFANAFTTTPLCAPARAGLLTGQHATTNGVLFHPISDGQGGYTGGLLSLDESSTLATWFQDAGYRTGHFGKYLNGYSFRSPEIPEGWDDWRTFVREANNFADYLINENGVVRSYGSAPADYSTDVVAAHALEFVEQSADEPFLLMFNPFAPHEPSTPAPRHAGAFAALPLWRPPSWGEDVSDKPAYLRFFAATNAELLAEDVEIQRQRESLLAVDQAVAALELRLEQLGLSDNTIFLFMSDHGMSWGEHRWINKQVPYEETIRIPLAIRYPVGLSEGDVRTEFALNIDVAPTLADLAGVTATHVTDGRSLMDAIDGAGDWRDDILVQHFTNGFAVPPWDLVRTEHHKLVRHFNGFVELYDLAADPLELDNVGALPAYAAIRAALSSRLDELLTP